MREISQTSQLIKKNMETLQTSTFDKLATLIKDKNTVKKTYVDNRERVDNQLLKVSELFCRTHFSENVL